MILIYEKNPPFACIYTESFAFIRESYALIFRESLALIRESFALICESYALIREKYIFFSTKMSLKGFRSCSGFCFGMELPENGTGKLILLFTSFIISVSLQIILDPLLNNMSKSPKLTSVILHCMVNTWLSRNYARCLNYTI